MASQLKSLTRVLTLTLIAAMVLLLLINGVGTSASVRLDCGDICYTFIGIPIRYRKLPDPERADLLAIARTSPKLSSKWIWIAFGGRHNPDLMCERTYKMASAWAHVDPTIARFILEDNADFIRKSHWQSGLPDSCLLDFVTNLDPLHPVAPDWKRDESVQEYCRHHSYNVVP